MRSALLLLVLAYVFPATAQNFTGIWGGKRTQEAGGCFPEYSLELHINFTGNNKIMGNAYSYYDKDRYTEVNFTGRYNPLTKRMVLIEKSVIRYSIPASCIPCVKTYDLNWSRNDTTEALTGEWKGHEMGNVNNCPPGKIYLTRLTKAVFPVEVFQDDTLSALQQHLKIQDREKELVQSIIIDTPSIKIELYDNAEIDDDTVTVFLNNTLLLYKKRLSDQPLTLNITAFPNTDYELMMYADNLGRIPPNTSLMIITAGQKQYEIHISSSEQKTAVVRFRYQR